MSAIAELLQRRAALLREGETALREGQVPSAEWTAQCQEVDDALRAAPSGLWRDGLAEEGEAAAAARRAAESDFAEAARMRRAQLLEELDGLRRGRTGLRGYGDAAQRGRAGGLRLDRQA